MFKFQYRLLLGVFLWGAGFLLSLTSSGQDLPLAQIDSDLSMQPSLLLPASGGYFPTQSEYPLLRGAANARSADGDSRTQGATGLFPYEDPVPNFYQRHPQVFRSLDQMLGVFLPQDAWTIESREMRRSSLTFDANLGGGLPLVRNFSPDLAMVKAGPLYFDLLWIGAGVIWSDFNGSQVFPNGGDGVVSYVELGMRGLFRFTDTIYLSVVGNLMYLPQSNEIAFGQGFGLQPLLGFGLDFVYVNTLGEWEIRFIDSFTGQPGFNLNLFSNVGREGFDSAGRYSFGFRQIASNNNRALANQTRAFFNNRISLDASRLVFGGAWRFSSALTHTDFFHDFSFTDHSYLDTLSMALQYDGSIIPFAPRFTYTASAFNGTGPIFHVASMSLTGRVTENIDWGGMVGYMTSTGGSVNSSDTITWAISLGHQLTARTHQSLSFGEGFFMDDVANQALTSRYISYRMRHDFARNLSFLFFVQASDQENPVFGRRGGLDATERAGGGATLTYRPLDFTAMSASIVHETSLKPANGYSHWLSIFQIQQQLGMRLTGNLSYQYEESYGPSFGFTEHMIQIGLRRYF